MESVTKAVDKAEHGALDPDRLLEQYGVGSARFAGSPHALYERHLKFDNVVELESSDERERYEAAARTVRDILSERWLRTDETYQRENPKRVYYVSIEFLIGRSLANNIMNLMIDQLVERAFAERGREWMEILDQEPDAGLGNGGLGRLAACFLDSMATMQLPAMGYGLRYEHGIFRQKIRNGWQEERSDNWLRHPDPWEVVRPNESVEVTFACSFEVRGGSLRMVPHGPTTLIGVPYDRPVIGYGGKTINTLRLWSATAAHAFDFQRFSGGDFVASIAEALNAESLTRVLYPDDHTPQGRGLRLMQEYFLVACSLADVVRRFRKSNTDWRLLPEKAAIQLNDTHPSLAVPELMRILLDEAHLDWDEAWDLTRGTLAYTNHTLLPEALERWPVEWMEALIPRQLEIIFEINRRLLDDIRARFPGDVGRLARTSLVEEGQMKQIRMANLAIVGSHSTNGVAAIHSELLRKTTVRDLAEAFPDRFNNKTNGVTPRRWLRLANPSLADAISSAIGDSWISDLSQLQKLRPLADNSAFRAEIMGAQRACKARFSDWVEANSDATVDPDTMFDCQVKRIHEYKRQLLNALRIVVLYNRLRENPGLNVPPRTFLFAGKAAPAYYLAKVIIKFINNLALTIDSDPAVRGRMNVLFLPEYNVSLAERLHSGGRRLEPDFHRGLRGERHQQHEVHDERRVDPRDARRRDHRDGGGGGGRELLPVRVDGRSSRQQPSLVQPLLALPERAGDAGGARLDLLRPFQPRRARDLRAAARRAAHPRRPVHAPRRPDVLPACRRRALRSPPQAGRMGAQGHPQHRRLREVLERSHDPRVRNRNLACEALPGAVERAPARGGDCA